MLGYQKSAIRPLPCLRLGGLSAVSRPKHDQGKERTTKPTDPSASVA